MPWVYKFKAKVTKQTLPVRSPLPNKQPSTRSAPAIWANSAAATAVPRSLCGCTLTITCSRLLTCLQNHSIWSAYIFGVVASIVAGKLKTILRSALVPHSAATALQTSTANSGSVVLKTSGEYSKRQLTSGYLAIAAFTMRVPSTANSRTSSWLISKTILRKAGAVALYM